MVVRQVMEVMDQQLVQLFSEVMNWSVREREKERKNKRTKRNELMAFDWLVGVLRGARVIEITENPFSITTWIREETGRRVEQPIHKPGFPHYYTCCNTGDRNISSFFLIDSKFYFVRFSFVCCEIQLKRECCFVLK